MSFRDRLPHSCQEKVPDLYNGVQRELRAGKEQNKALEGDHEESERNLGMRAFSV
jgi:hypothetical protein